MLVLFRFDRGVLLAWRRTHHETRVAGSQLLTRRPPNLRESLADRTLGGLYDTGDISSCCFNQLLDTFVAQRVAAWNNSGIGVLLRTLWAHKFLIDFFFFVTVTQFFVSGKI